MRRLAVLAALVFTSCGDTAPTQEVPAGFKSVIDALEANGDCGALQARFDDATATAELKYADQAMRDAGCYD